MQNRTTPERIDTPLPGQIPVVDTNLAGTAINFSAFWADKNCEGGMKDVTFGFNSHETAFGIPTKDEKIKTLPLDKIRAQVDKFIGWANVWRYARPDDVFLVTPIGCGLAGYTPEQIAPMFAEAVELQNVHLPASFWRVLNQK